MLGKKKMKPIIRANKTWSNSILGSLRFRSYNILGHPPLKVVFHWMLSSIEGRPPSKVIFYQTFSFIKGCLPSKVVFHQRFFSYKVIFHKRPTSIWGHHQRMSMITGCLPLKVVFHHRSSSIEDCLSSKVVFHLRFSSIIVCFQLRDVFSQKSYVIRGGVQMAHRWKTAILAIFLHSKHKKSYQGTVGA